MTSFVEIRLAASEDIKEISALALKSFGAELTDRIVYGSRGFSNYMKDQIESSKENSDIKYVVAFARGELVGFCEILCSPPELFLNYIFTDKDQNISGLGSFLLHKALEMLEADHFFRMVLDVFTDNLVAVQWYRNLGFAEFERHSWWDIPLEPLEGKIRGYLSHLPQAGACQERFGFSSFQVKTSGQVYEVGMLGEKWFRVTSPEILQDRSALTLLHRLDGTRRLLAILPGDSSCPNNSKGLKLATALRLAVAIPTLRQNLSARLTSR